MNTGTKVTTHDKIELPPLPTPDFPGVVIKGMKAIPRYLFSGNQMAEYGQQCATAAIEADRKRRGEPIQPSEIVATEAPLGAIENGRAFADRLENDYSFECQGGPLHNCSDWQEFRRCFEHLAEWALSQAPQPAKPVEVTLDFDQIGCAGPFPIVNGRVHVPAVTTLDLVRMAQSADPVKYKRLSGWTHSGIESLCISLDIQQEQSGGGSKACAVAASLLRGIAEQHFSETEKPL